MKTLIFVAVSLISNVAGFSASIRAATKQASSTQLLAEVNGSIPKKKVLVLGGDGFCGWPTSLHLSDQGHDVVVVDNLSRRNIDIELGCDSLTPISSPEVRSENSCAVHSLFIPNDDDFSPLVDLPPRQRCIC
jgi:UDP-sulfoquinovose synthase